MGRGNAWILPGLLNCKEIKLRNVGVSKKGGHDYAFSGVHIVLEDFQLCSHRESEGLRRCAVIMLATLRRICDDVDEMEEAGNVGRPLAGGADDVLRGWGRAGVIPSISPTCPGVAIEPSFA